MPERIQLRRKKGWRMPENTVKVDRTTPYGNPFVVGRDGNHPRCVHLFRMLMGGLVAVSTGATFKAQQDCRDAIERDSEAMRGKNLACWCGLNDWCHADVLLEVWNQPSQPNSGE